MLTPIVFCCIHVDTCFGGADKFFYACMAIINPLGIVAPLKLLCTCEAEARRVLCIGRRSRPGF